VLETLRSLLRVLSFLAYQLSLPSAPAHDNQINAALAVLPTGL
jgi:hypothetical protein